MRKIAMAAALSTVIASSAASETRLYNGYEIPAYEVIAAAGAIELRSYAPHVVAEVQVRGNRRQGARAGFRALANFIFGGNAASQKIAMTAPVTQIDRSSGMTRTGNGDTWTVRFMMPSRHALETLPTPKNATVALREVDPGTRLVVQFSGRALTGSLEKHAVQLQSYATQAGLTLAGPMEIAYYNDPFTLPWRRRNEVSFAVID